MIRPATQGEHITGKPKGENEKRKSHSSFQTDLNTHLLCKVCKIYEPMYADEKYQAKKWKHNSDIVGLGIENSDLFGLFSRSHNSKGGRECLTRCQQQCALKNGFIVMCPARKKCTFFIFAFSQECINCGFTLALVLKKTYKSVHYMTAKLTHGLLMLHMVHIWLRLAYKFARYAKYFYVNKIPLRRNGHQIRKKWG